MFYSHNSCLDAVDTIEDGPSTVCLCPAEATPTTSAYVVYWLSGPQENTARDRKDLSKTANWGNTARDWWRQTLHDPMYICITKFTEGHQYQRTDGLVGTVLMPYKAHYPNINTSCCFRFHFTRNMRFETIYWITCNKLRALILYRRRHFINHLLPYLLTYNIQTMNSICLLFCY